jgi:hypothetical protein
MCTYPFAQRVALMLGAAVEHQVDETKAGCISSVLKVRTNMTCALRKST